MSTNDMSLTLIKFNNFKTLEFSLCGTKFCCLNRKHKVQRKARIAKVFKSVLMITYFKFTIGKVNND